jgi:hypothetical protein
MDIGDYEVGGDWTQSWRSIHINTSGWIRGGDMPTYLHRLRTTAVTADNFPTKANLVALHEALRKLDREILYFERKLEHVRSMVAAFEAVVLRARDEWTEPAPVDNGIPYEDDLLERMSDLYGIPKPKPRR